MRRYLAWSILVHRREQGEIAEQTIQRRADFMGHHGEEIGFGLLPGKGPVTGVDQFLFCPDTMGNIAHEADNDHVITGFRFRQRQFDGENLPVPPFRLQPHAPLADDTGLTACQQLPDPVQMRLTQVIRYEEIGDILPEGFLHRIAENPLGGGIEIQDIPPDIGDCNRIQRGFEDGVLAGIGVRQFNIAPLDLLADASRMHQHQHQRRHENQRHKGEAHQGAGHSLPALIGQSGEIAEAACRHLAQQEADFSVFSVHPVKPCMQFLARPVNQRDHRIKAFADLRQRAGKTFYPRQRLIERPRREGGCAAVKDVKFDNHLIERHWRRGLMRTPDGELIFQKFNLGLGENPLHIIGTGAAQIPEFPDNLRNQKPDCQKTGKPGDADCSA